jgi:DNA-binding NarL/FixJ family response regulator
MIRVLLADDDALMRAGLGVVLDNAAGIDVAGEVDVVGEAGDSPVS